MAFKLRGDESPYFFGTFGDFFYLPPNHPVFKIPDAVQDEEVVSVNCAMGTVHTLATTFQESCVNVPKGSSLMAVPAAQSFHILANGTWVNGNAQPANRIPDELQHTQSKAI